MARSQQYVFATVKTEGAILPADLLGRIVENDPAVPGLKPEDYHLAKNEKVNEFINRSWNRLVSAWKSFNTARYNLPENDLGTTLTRERWLLILFQELGYGRLLTSKAFDMDGKSYPVSHIWQNTPIHLVSFKIDLDRRTRGVAGASSASPHSLVQEFLNRSQQHLWAFVSNGLKLRILRDNISLTRQAYVEFDLESMMEGEVYSDFVLLWLLCHQSGVESENAYECRLEKWSKFAHEQGVRALDGLRDGVANAISILGEGFISFSGNRELKGQLKDGTLDKQDFYRELLRLVYRLIFLFVAEDRELLLCPQAPEEVRERYYKYYSTGRFRKMAHHFRGTGHYDLYRALRLTMEKLSSDEGCPELGLPALGSFLWGKDSIPHITGCDISNRYFLNAVRSLAYIQDNNVRRAVDYQNLGAEELGSVYESLLELHPNININAGTFRLDTAGGNERKTTGSYYTPTSLINCLLDSALDPVVNNVAQTFRSAKNGAFRSANTGNLKVSATDMNPAETAILNLKICDPACGSGHFLIAAAHRMAKKLASVRTGEEEPPPDATRHALRDVIGRCIYGVDINPMAVELCKVSLWMEALEPGKPLSFLDHHIKCGNSLIGATPALIDRGIPDEAFTPVTGDDKKYCSRYKKQNKEERESYGKEFEGQLELFGRGDDYKPWEHLGNFASAMMKLENIDDGSIEGIHRREKMYEENVNSQGYLFNKLLADAWCAAFMWKKVPPDFGYERDGHTDGDSDAEKSASAGYGSNRGGLPYPITEEIFRRIERTPFSCPIWMKEEIRRLAKQYQFFHWHLEFPDVFKPHNAAMPVTQTVAQTVAQTFRSASHTASQTASNASSDASTDEIVSNPENPQTGWMGGFDMVLGNPPWERIKLQEKEWFADREPEIANAQNASIRKKMIDDLKRNNPALYNEFEEDKRKAEGDSHFVRSSDMYPLCGRGDVNTYTIFAELNRTLMNDTGRVGCIVPSGIATDDTTKYFFRDLMNRKSLVSLFDFENRKGIFPGVHRSYKFCLLTLTGINRPAIHGAQFVFFAHEVSDLLEKNRAFSLTGEEIELLNPNTQTCPIFRSKNDAELTKAIYRRVPVLIREYYDNKGKVVKEDNPWGIKFSTMFHMANDSHLFRTREQLEGNGWTLDGNVFSRGDEQCLPLYEAKMTFLFDHRHGNIIGKENVQALSGIAAKPTDSEQYLDPDYYAIPRYWLSESEVKNLLKNLNWQQKWFICLRDVARSTDVRTGVFTILPYSGVGHKAPLILPYGISAIDQACLLSDINSYIVDYVIRQKIGGASLSYFIVKQIPVFMPISDTESFSFDKKTLTKNWIFKRVLELTYTAWDLQPFAIDCGYDGPPFKWNEERRFLLRCELDAAYFHLYKIHREDVDYIMETFPIVKRKDEAKFDSFYSRIPFAGECCEKYRSPETGKPDHHSGKNDNSLSNDEPGTKYAAKAVILEIYDRMKEAMETGIPYQTVLSPPPADPSCAHPPE